MIGTQGLFETRYGYFEARVKLQSQVGHWSAFWLQSPLIGDDETGDTANFGTEIDVMEYQRQEGDVIRSALHWDGYGVNTKAAKSQSNIKGVSSGWHTTGVLWDESGYTFFVDGRQTWKINEAISGVEQYIILSLEVGNWAGDISSSTLPDDFLIDYVRVYKKLTV